MLMRTTPAGLRLPKSVASLGDDLERPVRLPGGVSSTVIGFLMEAVPSGERGTVDAVGDDELVPQGRDLDAREGGREAVHAPDDDVVAGRVVASLLLKVPGSSSSIVPTRRHRATPV